MAVDINLGVLAIASDPKSAGRRPFRSKTLENLPPAFLRGGGTSKMRGPSVCVSFQVPDTTRSAAKNSLFLQCLQAFEEFLQK